MTLSREEIKKRFDLLGASKTKEEVIDNEAMMLHFRVMQLVEQAMEKKGYTKKQLAEKIGTSQSYLTQLFFGDKTANLKTMAKFQEALDVSFKMDTEHADETLVAWKIRKTLPSENSGFKVASIKSESSNETCNEDLAA